MIMTLSPGMHITPTRLIENARVRHWKYRAECASVGGGLMPGAQLRVAEVGQAPGHMFVVAQLPGSDPPRFLKISGAELGPCFRVSTL
jgi:hypothetical protein